MYAYIQKKPVIPQMDNVRINISFGQHVSMTTYQRNTHSC